MLQAPIAGEKRVLASRYARTLYEQDFTGSDGQTHIFSIWGYSNGSAALIFPVTTDGNVVAIRQYRHGAHDFMLEVPGGLPSGNEDFGETATRELLEETGYQVGTLVNLNVMPFPCAPSLDYSFGAFLGLGCEKIMEPDVDPLEQVEVILIPLQTWFEKIWSGEVLDGQMISLSMLVLPHLANIKFK